MNRFFITLVLLWWSIFIENLSPMHDQASTNNPPALYLFEPSFNDGSETFSVLVKVTDFPHPLIALGTSHNRIYLCNPFTQELIRKLHHDHEDNGKYNRGVTSLLPFIFEERPSLIAGYADGSVRIWDLTSCHCIMYFHNHSDSVIEILALSPTLIATRSYDSTITIYDTSTNAILHTLHSCDGFMQKLPNTMMAAVFYRNTISILNPQTGKCIKTLVGHKDDILALAYIAGSSKKPLLISGALGGEIKVWNLSNYKCLFTVQLKNLEPFSFRVLTPTRIAIATTQGVIIYDLLKKSFYTLRDNQHLISIKTDKSTLLSREKDQIHLYNINNLPHRPNTYSIESNDAFIAASADIALFSNYGLVVGYQNSIFVLQELGLTIEDVQKKINQISLETN